MLMPLAVGVAAVRISAGLERLFDRLMMWNLLLLTPVLSMFAFWGYRLHAADVMLPVIGILMMIVPGVVAWVTLRKSPLPLRQQGSLVIASLFSSRTTIGLLTVYVFCGEAGYSLGRLVMTMGPVFFYAVGFPLANYYANAAAERFDLRRLLLDPKMLPVAGLFAGVLLNRYGPSRPDAVDTVFPWMVAVNTWLFIIPVGLSLQVRGLGAACWRRALWLIPLRYAVVPVTMALLCLVMRVPADAFRVILLLSLSPVATGAVIMGRIYRIDRDMVMAAYLATVGFFLLVILPLLLALSRFVGC
jgi:hypothetical protein